MDIKNRIKNANFYLRIVIVLLPSVITYMTTNSIDSWIGFGTALIAVLSNPVALLTNVLAIYHSFTSTLKKVDDEMDEEEKTEDEIKI